MSFKHLIGAMALTLVGGAASAATIALTADNDTALASPIPGQDFEVQLGNAGATTLFDTNMSLQTDGEVTLIFSLVGVESGFDNSLLFGTNTIISETAQQAALGDFTTGHLFGQRFATNFNGDLATELSFSIDDGVNPVFSFNSVDDEFGVFADANQIGALSTFYLALDDSGADDDDNHDDIIVRVDVAAVPLPASGLLLLAGLGGVAGMRRFRRKS